MLVELGSAEARAGEPAAREHLTAARELADEPWLQAQATIELLQVLAYEGRMSEATALALETLEATHDTPEVARAIRMALLVFGSGTDLAARRMTRELVSRAVQAVERLGDSAPRSLLAMIAWETAFVKGTAENAAALAERALADGRLIDEQPAETALPVIASLALEVAGREDIAERELTVEITRALQHGSARGFAIASAVRAMSRYRTGALDGAESDAHAFLSVAREPGWDLWRPMALSALVDVLVERGELAAASAVLAEWDVGPQAPDSSHAQPLRGSRARLLLAQGRPHDALAELTAYARWERDWGAENGLLVQWRSAAAIAHATLGDTKTALDLVTEELRRTRRFGAPGAIGITFSAAGLVERGEHGIELLREAVTHLERSHAHLEYARALVRVGGAIRRAGRRVEARAPLRSGLDLAAQLGAAALTQTARAELLAAGARPRRASVTGRDSLTPSERRVTDLAAAGHSNRHIAQSLFLTVRTIEMHLTNAYRKLNISSRDQLPAALSEQQPPAAGANASQAPPPTGTTSTAH